MALYYDVVGLLFLSGVAFAAHGFGYDGDNGPSHWSEDHKQCAGKKQSPINIDESMAQDTSLPPLQFFGLDDARCANLTNNGHSVVLNMDTSPAAGVSGGPLGNDKYVFAQLHFHWGTTDGEGSEDVINNQAYAMQMHIVHYKQSYGSLSNAVKNSDGLAVLGYFFESGEDNSDFQSLVDALSDIKESGAKTTVSEDFVVRPFYMPKSGITDEYFTFDGSLTTPPCSEVVTWIDFKNPASLSSYQISPFRDVKDSDGNKLSHNFRPVQSLGSRTIYHVASSKSNEV